MSYAVRRTVRLPDGTPVNALGQGAWNMGENPEKKAAEIAALKAGISAGMTLIDTAEMYGGGRSERLVREAIKGIPRESLFIVSKVLPTNASSKSIFTSCDTSLLNLGVTYLDMYLLHWRSGTPLSETVECLERLVHDGKIRRWGVSNFDVPDMEDLWRVPAGINCAVNQVLYHLGSRGIEFDLMPWQAARKVPIMAYCPLAQAGDLNGKLYNDPAVLKVAQRHKATVSKVLLAFVLHSGSVIPIPKSSSVAHTEENAAADAIKLTENDMKELNAAFPPPSKKVHLDLA